MQQDGRGLEFLVCLNISVYVIFKTTYFVVIRICRMARDILAGLTAKASYFMATAWRWRRPEKGAPGRAKL